MSSIAADIPRLALGVWQVPDGPECENAVRWALELGYRHIDTAQAYGNEASVGRAIADQRSVAGRDLHHDEVLPGHKDPAAEAQRSLERLGRPTSSTCTSSTGRRAARRGRGPGMEQAKADGSTRRIGISNFSLAQVDELLGVATEPPVVDQVEVQPFEYRRALLEAAASAASSSRPTARSGRAAILRSRSCSRSRSGSADPGSGPHPLVPAARTIVLPKSTHRERIEENGRVFDFELSDQDMEELDGLDTTGGTAEARESQWW